jgi:hypothetical protein
MIKILERWKWLFLSIILLWIFNESKAQDIPSVVLRLSPQLELGVQVVYISDLDLLDQGVANYFFDVELWNVRQDWENTRVFINILQNGESIASAETDEFTLVKPDPEPPPGSPSYTANNIDLLNAGIFPGSGMVFDFRISYDLPDENFEDVLFQSGKLERGVYHLQIVLDNPGWGFEEVKAEIRLNIINPSLIYLQAPPNQDVVHTEFPFFQYESDATEFTVYVYKRRNIDDDIETILSGHPTLEYTTSLKQFSYNITDGDPLEPGATYFWYVKALVYTSHGLEDFRSEVWQFTVDTEDGLGRLDIAQLLEPLLGSRAQDIAVQLSNFELKTITLNGRTITLEEFYQVLADYQDSVFGIQDLELE